MQPMAEHSWEEMGTVGTGVMSRVIMAGPAVFGSNSTNWEQDILRYPSPTQSIRAYGPEGYRHTALRCTSGDACLDNPMHAMVTVNHASSGGGGGLIVSDAPQGTTAFRSNGGVRMEYGYIYTGGSTTLGSDTTQNMHMFGNPYKGVSMDPRAPEANNAQLQGGANELIILRAKAINIQDITVATSSDFFLDARGTGQGGIVLPYSTITRTLIEGQTSNILCMTGGGYLGVCNASPSTTPVLGEGDGDSDSCAQVCTPATSTLQVLDEHCTCEMFRKV